MLYTQTVMDRSTGDVETISIGDWLTVTEVGKRYGVGPRKIRAVLHHMGLLRQEGGHGRYRLAPFAVERGYGKRHEADGRRIKHAFDVISPLGQELIAKSWNLTVTDLDAETAADRAVSEAKAALEAWQQDRGRELKVQEAVSWLRYHAPHLTIEQIAKVLDSSDRLVRRYIFVEKRQREFLARQRAKQLKPKTDQHAIWSGIAAAA